MRSTEAVPGEMLLYLGRHYQLDFVDDQAEGVRFRGGRFLVARSRRGEAGRLLGEWNREKARRRLAACATCYARDGRRVQ